MTCLSSSRPIITKRYLVTGSSLSAVIKHKYLKKIVVPITILLLGQTLVPWQHQLDFYFLIYLLWLQLFLLAHLLFSLKFVPYKKHIEFTPAFAMMFVAIFGTTTSPYLFFWQASEEAEEDVEKHKIKEIGKGNPKISKKEKSMRQDTTISMAFSQLIMWSIMMTAAGIFHAHGITNIQTADQAAKSLEPLVKIFPQAGEISKTIFALGIICTGLLAVPVLAGLLLCNI